MPEKQFRTGFFEEIPILPRAGPDHLPTSAIFPYFSCSSNSDPNHTGTKYSPAINLRSKILSQYLTVNGKVTWISPTPKHTKNPTYEVKISFFKHFFYGCFISYVHVYINNTTKSPGEEFLNIEEFGKDLKTLQSTLCNV